MILCVRIGSISLRCRAPAASAVKLFEMGASSQQQCLVKLARIFCTSHRQPFLRASDREVNAPEETHIEIVRHVAAVRPTPCRRIDVCAVI